MTIGATAILFLPFALYYSIRLQIKQLIYLFVLATPFIASSIVIIPGSDFGMQPAYVIAVLLIITSLIKGLRTSFKVERRTAVYISLTLLCLLYATLSILFPFLHSFLGNQVVTINTGQLMYYAPLRFEMKLVNQLCYFCLFVFTTLIIAQEIKTHHQLITIMQLLILGAVINCLWAILVNVVYTNIFNNEYPYWLFNNNVGFAQGYSQTLFYAGKKFSRICSLAHEPSVLGLHLSIILTLVFFLNFRKIFLFPAKVQKAIFWLLFIVSLISTSTTAIAGIFFLIAFIGIYIFMTFLKGHWLTSQQGLTNGFLFFIQIGLTTVGLIIIVIFAYNVTLKMIQMIYTMVTVSKMSQSGSVRFDFALHGIKVLIDTLFIGAGWGSCRTADVGSTLLANIGIIGFILFYLPLLLSAMQCYSLIKKYHTSNFFFAGICIALFFTFLQIQALMLISYPDLTITYVWVIWGIIFALPQIEHTITTNQISLPQLQK